MAPRKKKTEVNEKAAELNPLLDAFKFVAIAQQEHGITYQCHAHVGNGFVSAFNGLIGAGMPYEETFSVCPHTFRMIDALERVKGHSALSILPTNQINVKDDKRFDAMVPCATLNEMQVLYPDPARWPISDTFRKAAEVAGLFTAEGAPTVVQASLLTKDGSIVGTNTHVLIEVWHGISMPPGLCLPKVFFSTLAKIKKPLKLFGFSETSFTVWFEDGSYLKTQVYSEQWPNIDAAFDYFNEMTLAAPPEHLFEAVKAVTSFSSDGRFYLSDDLIHSHRDTQFGARYACPGVKSGQSFVAKFMLVLEPHITQLDMNSSAPVAGFYGGDAEIKIRGFVTKST